MRQFAGTACRPYHYHGYDCGIEYRKPDETALVLMKEHFDAKYAEMCYVKDNIKKEFTELGTIGIESVWYRNMNLVLARK